MNAIQEILDGRRGRVFAPIVYRLAAALEGLSEEEMEDPATAVYALGSAQQLFGLPVLFSQFGSAGGAGVETASRLVAQLGDATPVVGVLGPAPSVEEGRAYLEAGAAALLVAEAADEGVLTQIANVAQFFSRPLLGLAEHGVVPAEAIAASEPGVWLQHPPGLLLTDGEVPAGTDPAPLRAWCEAFAAVGR